MRRRVSPDDLRHANRLTRQHDHPGGWFVCDEYNICNEEVVAKYPARNSEGISMWRSYRPLEEAPDLFLKLAAVYEAPSFTEAALTFSHKYGVLGGNSNRQGGTENKTSLSSWWEEAQRAWVILKLYEAALNWDGEAAKRLHAEYDNIVLEEMSPNLRGDEIHPGKSWQIAQEALIDSTLMVQETVQLLCRPAIASWGGSDPLRVEAGWQFDNLLGAMYLQMFWLMISGDDLTRCEYCGRTIALARTHPQGRKRRRDKRFCDDACRQAHHRSTKKA